MSDFKQKLRRRETVSLVNPDHPSSSLVHFMGSLGVDAVMIDCEQGSPGFEAVEDMTRAARLNGVSAIVRIPSTEPWTIERYMMRNIDGLVIPRLDRGEQARRAVEEVRYCTPKDFERKTIIVQIESATAVADLDAFLAIDEIDCFFIGVVDLAKSLGFRGNYAAPEVTQAIDGAIARILEAGRCVGIMVKDHDIASWQARGVTMLYTHLNDFAAMGAASWKKLAGQAG